MKAMFLQSRQTVLWLMLATGALWLVTSAAGMRAVAQTPAPVPTASERRAEDEPPQASDDSTHQPARGDADSGSRDGDVRDVADEGESGLDGAATAPSEAPEAAAPPAVRVVKEAKSYGLWALMPAIVAIILAIFTRQVIPALVVGILVGAYMMLPCRPSTDPLTQTNAIVGGFRLAVENYVLGVIHHNPSSNKALDKIMIMVFTLVIGFMVGVIGHNGGTAGMVRLVTGKSASQRRGALTAWLSGMVVFFDDYANAMIVGPTMRPVFDRLKLSRAKLAYIVDSTAAPVASLALIGTWVGAEISYIQDGLNVVEASGAPAFLLNDAGAFPNGMHAFINSIPYRYYAILALFLVFLVSLTGRDFGPMKRAQRRAAAAGRGGADSVTGARSLGGASAGGKEVPPRWWLGLAPVFTLLFTTITVLVASGWRAEETVAAMSAVTFDGQSTWAALAWWEKASTVMSNADPYGSILYGAILAAFAAVLLTVLARAVSTVGSISAGVEGMCRMFPAIVILVLAWALSQVLSDLQLGRIAAERLQAANFDVHWLPLTVFIVAAIISFSTGTSWGTMGILCPTVVQIAAQLAAGIDPAEAMALFYASIGSVLAGAVFGDHCSPISDTTVLSAIACDCTLEHHVWTQLPYALVAAVAAMAVGDVMSSAYNQPWYYGLGAGAVALVLVVFIVGRKSPPEPEPEPQPAPTAAR